MVGSVCKTKFLFLTLIFFGLGAKAQIKYGFEKDTLSINSDETFLNFLWVENTQTHAVVLYPDIVQSQLPKGLIRLPDSLVLQAGESKRYPLKYLADRQTIRKNLQLFKLVLKERSAPQRIQSEAVFYTQLVDVKGLSIGLEQDEIYLSQVNDQAGVLVTVLNQAYVPLTFTINLNGVPKGLEFTGDMTLRITLAPGEQRQIPYTVVYRSDLRRASDFTVTILARDDQGNDLAVRTLKVWSLKNTRNLGQFNSLQANPPNSATLLYANMNGVADFLQLRANGKVSLAERSTLEYRLNMDQYNQSGNKNLNIYDTYVDFQRSGWGIKLGTIYENSDFQLYGRGLRVNGRLFGKGMLSAYGLENNYLLFNGQSFNRQGARLLGFDYQYGIPGNDEFKFSYIFSDDKYTGLRAHQWSGKSAVIVNTKEKLILKAGLTSEKNYLLDNPSKPGFLLGADYQRNLDQIKFSGQGFYSSPYFTGLQRGLILAELRTEWQPLKDGPMLYVFGNAQMSRPKYQEQLGRLMYSNFKNAIYNYGVGYQTKIGPVYTTFNPYLMRQSLETNRYQYQDPENTDWDASSIRMKLLMGYNRGLYHLNLSTDYGYSYLNTSGNPAAPFHSLRMTMMYTMPLLGFNATMQLNPYYLTDVLNIGRGTRFRLYSFGPNARVLGFKNRLEFTFAALYNYYGYSRTNNYTLNSYAKYEFKQNWTLTAEIQYAMNRQRLFRQEYLSSGGERLDLENPVDNYVNNFSNDYRQIRIGIQKKFGHEMNSTLKKLKLNYFEDHNGNGERDVNEPAVAGLIVKINGESAQTNQKGHVEFGVGEKQSYTVMVNNTKGWSLPEPTVVYMDKQKELLVALVKTQALRGKIVVRKNQYVDNLPVLGGIRINARDVFGRQYQTFTDDHGAFSFYLPRNKYSVFIETKGLPFSIENATEEVVLQGGPLSILNFFYTDERRKVGVKRF